LIREQSSTPEANGSTPDTEGRRRLGVALCGLLAGLLLFELASRASSDFAADEVGLGRNTVAFTAEWQGRQIGGPLHDLPVLRESFRAARAKGRPVALWLGASQLYAINHPQPGQVTAVRHAAEASAERGSPLAWIQCASPNTNAHELLAMYLGLRGHGLRPEYLVLAVTYDDLKEPGLRETALDALRALPSAAQAELRTLGRAGDTLLAALEPPAGADGTAASAPIVRSATADTPQEHLETALTDWLQEAWPAYAERGPLRAAVVTAWKMPVTTLAFRILRRPQTPIPPDMAAWNESALWTLLELARRDGVAVLAYQAPHNPEPEPFFHPRGAYDRWHADFAARCAELGVDFVDLEALVPAGLWGQTNNFAPDVFHFREEGHALLGRAIDAELARRGG